MASRYSSDDRSLAQRAEPYPDAVRRIPITLLAARQPDPGVALRCVRRSCCGSPARDGRVAGPPRRGATSGPRLRGLGGGHDRRGANRGGSSSERVGAAGHGVGVLPRGRGAHLSEFSGACSSAPFHSSSRKSSPSSSRKGRPRRRPRRHRRGRSHRRRRRPAAPPLTGRRRSAHGHRQPSGRAPSRRLRPRAACGGSRPSRRPDSARGRRSPPGAVIAITGTCRPGRSRSRRRSSLVASYPSMPGIWQSIGTAE